MSNNASTIVKIENELYKIPLPNPMEDATHGVMTRFDLLITRVTNSEGQVGCGYTFIADLAGKATYSVAEEEIKPLVMGMDADRIEQIWGKIFDHLYFVGRGGIVSFALSAIDIALWDLRGKRANMPLWKLVGGYREKVKCYGGGVDLNLTPDELVENVKQYLSEGHKSVKIKVGKKTLAEDIARLEKVRAYLDSLDEEITLMVDCNCGWNSTEALRAAVALEKYDLYWLEEPLTPDNLGAHKRISELSHIPIAMGENFRSIYEFDRMLKYGHCDHPQPDVSNIGGITAFLKVAAEAQIQHLEISTHGMQEIAVSLLCGIPNSGYLEIHAFPLSDFMTWKVKVEDGMASPPNAPGTGVDFNSEKLKQYRVL